MNKQDLLKAITDNVRKKHPWTIAESKYLQFFGTLPIEYLNERLYYDNLVKKSQQFNLCFLTLSEVKIEIRLTLDQCIEWELARWEDAAAHNIVAKDIKKLLKE